MKINKTKAVILVLSGLLMLGSAFYLINFSDKGQSISEKNTVRGINDVDYGPPSEEEKDAGDLRKPSNVEQEKIESDPVSGTRNAEIVIVDSSQYDEVFEIRSFISNIFEDGGACTATFSKVGSSPVVTSSAGTTSATTTQCGKMSIPISSFASKGEWQLKLSYSSPAANGETLNRSVEIK